MKIHGEQIDKGWDVKRFAIWWLRQGKPYRAPEDAVNHVGKFAVVTLFRDGAFQVQQVIAQPHAHAPAHVHPNVDTIEMLVQGKGVVHVIGRPPQTGIFTRVAPGDAHTATAAETGASFLSIQKWLNGVAPTSVEKDWGGQAIDDAHAKELGRC